MYTVHHLIIHPKTSKPVQLMKSCFKSITCTTVWLLGRAVVTLLCEICYATAVSVHSSNHKLFTSISGDSHFSICLCVCICHCSKTPVLMLAWCRKLLTVLHQISAAPTVITAGQLHHHTEREEDWMLHLSRKYPVETVF